jgi:predicted lactoylglutathione lyase
MENKLGIQNLKVVVSFFIAIALQIDKVKSDDKITKGEILKLIFFVLMNKGISAFSSFLEAGKEVLDLTNEEKDELSLFFSKEFDLSNEETEALIESTFSILLSIFTFILKVRSMFGNKDSKKELEKLEKVLS